MLIFALLAHPALAAEIEVSLDRNPVPINESFTLSFTAHEEPDGEPDFSPLQSQFEILNQGQSNQVSIVNGRATRSIVWQLQVLAKHPGTLEIPPIAFGRERSRPFAVTITNGAVRGKQGGEASISVEAEAEPKNPYVQAQVILTIRVLSRVAFSGDLAQPEAPDAVFEKLDEDREYVTLREGVQFKVNERRYAVFPQKSGRVTIGPVNLTAQLSRPGGAGFGPFFRSPTRQQRLHSEPVELDVRPIPPGFTGKHWLPVRRLELTGQWQPETLQIPEGEPVTRTVTLKAEGASIGMLPELASPGLPPGEVKQYPDQPVLQEEKTPDGLVSQRQQKVALMAAQPGRFVVPALELPWWNTVTDRQETARLPAQTVTVTSAARSPSPESPATPATPPSSITEATPTAGERAVNPPAASENPWVWLAAGLGLGWAMTALAWWFSLRRRQPPPASVSPAAGQSEAALLKLLDQACRRHDASAARKALSQWLACRWPEVNAETRPSRLGAELTDEITQLNRHVYAPASGAWNGSRLRDLLARLPGSGNRLASEAAENPDGMEPLNRIY